RASGMHPSERFLGHRHAGALADLVQSFLPRFPELDETEFELDLLPSSSWLLGLAEQDRAPPRIRLRPARPTNPTLTYTIPHELTHLLQVPLRLVPGGERSCDLFAMARAGDRFLVPPGYVRVPPAARRDWDRWSMTAAVLARAALVRRSEGTRTYIAWWERSLLRLVVPPGSRAIRSVARELPA
ncbi:MAG TPA: hypothetical protein VEM95_05890, partial [Thermoplasmata archaeon]|nr:hypothetical protein [Thermoplasmata archaeon]